MNHTSFEHSDLYQAYLAAPKVSYTPEHKIAQVHLFYRPDNLLQQILYNKATGFALITNPAGNSNPLYSDEILKRTFDRITPIPGFVQLNWQYSYYTYDPTHTYSQPEPHIYHHTEYLKLYGQPTNLPDIPLLVYGYIIVHHDHLL